MPETVNIKGHGKITEELFVVPEGISIYIPAAIGTKIIYKNLKYEISNIANFEEQNKWAAMDKINLHFEKFFLEKIKPYCSGSLCHDISFSRTNILFSLDVSLHWKNEKGEHEKYNFELPIDGEIKLSEVIEKLKNSEENKMPKGVKNIIVFACMCFDRKVVCYPENILNTCLQYIIKTKSKTEKEYEQMDKEYKNQKTEKEYNERLKEYNTFVEKVNSNIGEYYEIEGYPEKNVYFIDRKLQGVNFPFVREFFLEHFRRNYELGSKTRIEIDRLCDENNEEKLKTMLLENNLLYELWYYDFYTYIWLEYKKNKPLMLKTQNYCEKIESIPYLGHYVGCLLIHLHDTCFDFREKTGIEHMDNMLETMFKYVKPESIIP